MRLVHTVEKELLQGRFIFFPDALHHALGTCSRERNIARKNKAVVFLLP
jgi:hypothetical protein